MGKETKVGLLVGMSFIVCVAIVLSHRGKTEDVPQSTSFEIATVLSDAPVPPVRPEPREQLDLPRQRRSHTDTDSADEQPSRRTRPGLSPGIGETRPGLPPQIDAQVAAADIVDVLPRVAEAITRFTRRAEPLPASFAGDTRFAGNTSNARPSPIVASRSAMGSSEPLHLMTPTPTAFTRRSGGGSSGIVAAQTRRSSSNPPETYVIQPGDTLGLIAQKHYGTCRGGVVQAICDANRDAIADPDRVVVGRTIVLPPLRNERAVSVPHVETETETVVAQNAQPQDTRESTQSYTVRPGDTLTRIARKHYGSSDPELLDAIVQANREWMRDADHVVVGRTLRLPNRTVPDASVGGRRVAVVAEATRPASEVGSDESDRPRGREGIDWTWYQLKKGDVYSTVAAAQLGTAKRWRELAEMNADIFPDPGRIRWGVRIRIPLSRGLTATRRGDA